MKTSPVIIHIMGTTCSGKTTLINELMEEIPDCGAVQIGKILREKYPPEYFEGSAAPEKTKEEALKLYKEGIERCAENGCRVVLVDGQPRTSDSIDDVLACGSKHEFFFIYEFLNVMELRARKRDTTRDEYALTKSRITNDKVQLFDVICEMSLIGRPVNITWYANATCKIRNLLKNKYNVTYNKDQILMEGIM